MSTSNPYPDVSALVNAAVESGYRRWQDTPNRAAYVHMEMTRVAYEAAEKAGGAIVAETLRMVAAAIEARPVDRRALAVLLRDAAESAGKGFTVDSPAPAGSAEGSGHPQPATVPYDGPTYTVGGPGFVRPPGWVPAEELAEMDGADDV